MARKGREILKRENNSFAKPKSIIMDGRTERHREIAEGRKGGG